MNRCKNLDCELCTIGEYETCQLFMKIKEESPFI